ARELLTQGGTCRSLSTAFFASNPAASMTDGLEVFVQLVIAAITIEPWSRYLSTSIPNRSLTDVVLPGSGDAFALFCSFSAGWPPSPSHLHTWRSSLAFAFGPFSAGSCFSKLLGTSLSRTRSCGRLGPATLGSMVARSSDKDAE